MAKQLVAANQKAVDALRLNSGTWRVIGTRGLYVRCRAQSKLYFVRRRVDGVLIDKTIGEVSVRAAKDAATAEWTRLEKPKASLDGAVRLGVAIEQYLSARPLAETTLRLARYNAKRYLDDWKDRTLAEIGRDRASVRLLQQVLTKKHKPATSNQVMRLLSAVYRWHRKVNTDLPESPMVVAEIHRIKARDWAYSPDELKVWWLSSKEEEDGTVVPLGVSTLGPIKRMWWLTALFTGGRKGSLEALRWTDVDLDKKVIRFKVAKGDRPYTVPMADKLAELLSAYKTNTDVPQGGWIFPSPMIEGAHLIDVKNPNEGVGPAHRLRHTYRTTLAELGASPDQARMLMGHSMGGDVSRGYITTPLVVESLRAMVNAVAQHYLKFLTLE